MMKLCVNNVVGAAGLVMSAGATREQRRTLLPIGVERFLSQQARDNKEK
jgi:hypothetical protein